MINLDEELKKVKSVAVSGHIRPDGDCIGSTMAVYLYIRRNYPDINVRIFLEPCADIFACIKDFDKIESAVGVSEQFDLFVACDTGSERLGDAKPLFDNALRTINIDHHVSNPGTGDACFVDPDASSASELVARLLDRDKVDSEIAKALYIGIIHDTGVMQYSNTSSKTLTTLAWLISYDFDASALIEKTFYEKTYVQMQLLGRALTESFVMMDGRVVVSHIDSATMKFFKAQTYDLDGIVSQLRQIRGVDVAIFMYEIGNMQQKVSLRSNGVIDVSKVCEAFGGGGHVRAAGCILEGNFYDVVNNLNREIDRQYKKIG